MTRQRPRKACLDMIRALATVMVVLFHFNVRFETYSVDGFHSFLLRHANGSFGALGVDLFFLLSGAALLYTYEEELDMRRFFRKRFLAIFPLYWFTWAVFYAFVVGHGLRSPFWGGVLPRLLLTATAMDGWLAQTTRTYFLVGEWFTGVIVVIYLLFPLLRWLYLRHYKAASTAIAVLYLVNLKLRILAFSNGAFSLTGGIALFWLGMSLQKCETAVQKADPLWFFLPFCVLLGVHVPFLNSNLVLAVMGTLLYLALWSAFWRWPSAPRPLAVICRYSYPIYLVHHRVIHLFFQKFLQGQHLSAVESAALFVMLFLFILALSAALQHIVRAVLRLLDLDRR